MNAITTTGGDSAIVQWDPNSGAALPAYLSDAASELGSNIPDRTSVPTLSYEGKTWTIIINNNKTKLQAANSDGDMVPVPVMRCVILNFNADRGRAYYEGTYNPAAAAAPKCWSADSRAPDDSAKEKQSALCSNCPQAVKGSKIADGRESVACSTHRMLAIAPAFDLSGEPLRLKIAVTSDWDKEIVDHGWFAFRQYVDYLKSRGVSNTALVVTKIKFDTNTAYPKLLFALDRVLSPDEIGKVKVALANPEVTKLLAEKWTVAGANGKQKDEGDTRPYGLEGAYLDGWVAHPDAAGYSYKGQEVLTNEAVAALYPAPAPVVPAAQQTIEHKPSAPPVPEAAAPPPVVDKHDPLVAAMADGWAVHPDNTAYYFKGAEVAAAGDVMVRYLAPAAAAPVTPPAPPLAPELSKVPEKSPREKALEAGWVQHPDSPPHGYLGSEVLDWAAIEAKFSVGDDASVEAAPPAAQAGAGTTTSPTDDAIPAEVQALLGKWAG